MLRFKRATSTPLSRASRIHLRAFASANDSPILKNQLAKSESPYLQNHKLNPVSWQEWNKDSLALSSQLNKPSKPMNYTISYIY